MDWNNDGYNDLIIGEYGVKTGVATGKVWYFERNSDGTLKAGVKLLCGGQEITGRYLAPCIVDWNNDGLLDMLVGTTEDTLGGVVYTGAIRYYENTGTKEQYQFTVRDHLTKQDGSLIKDHWYGRVHVKVADLNNDGKKDIVTGGWAASGEYFFHYENVGTDAAPEFSTRVKLQKTSGGDMTTFAPHYNQRFDLWDWNGDGYEDIIWADYKQTINNEYLNPIYISYSSTNGVIDLEDPTVAFTAPQAGTVSPGDSVDVSWAMQDNVGVVGVTLEVSVDGEQSWQTVMTGTSEESYRWPAGTTDLTQVKFRVTAVDANGNSGVALSEELAVVTALSSSTMRRVQDNIQWQDGVVQLTLSQPQRGVVSVYSPMGRCLYSSEGVFGQGVHRFTVSGLSKGVYLMRFDGVSSKFQQRVVW